MKTARQLAARKAAKRVRYKRRGVEYDQKRQAIQAARKKLRKWPKWAADIVPVRSGREQSL